MISTLNVGGTKYSLAEAESLGLAGAWSIMERKNAGWSDLHAVFTPDFHHSEAIRNNFGLLVAIDLYNLNQELARDEEYTRAFLNDVPTAIGMTVIVPAITKNYQGGKKAIDDGITGMVVLAESHCAWHAFPGRNFATFCCYSCNVFDPAALTQLVTFAFGCNDYEVQTLHRGKRFQRRDRKDER